VNIHQNNFKNSVKEKELTIK